MILGANGGISHDLLTSRVALVLLWVLLLEFSVAVVVNAWKVWTVNDALRPMRAFKLGGSTALALIYAASIIGGLDPLMSVIVARTVGVATTPVVWILSSMFEVPPVPVLVPEEVIVDRLESAVQRVLGN